MDYQRPLKEFKDPSLAKEDDIVKIERKKKIKPRTSEELKNKEKEIMRLLQSPDPNNLEKVLQVYDESQY